MELFETYIQMVVIWLKKIPKMGMTLQEMEAVPNLYLVDPKAAIVESHTELLETLGKLFGNCTRANHFFAFYDTNQTDPVTIQPTVPVCKNSYGVVVQDCLDIDFESNRTRDFAAYTDLVNNGITKDRMDQQHGLLFNFVQLFAAHGGFDAVCELLEMGLNEEKAQKLPFQITT
jgi:hypothetical protein